MGSPESFSQGQFSMQQVCKMWSLSRQHSHSSRNEYSGLGVFSEGGLQNAIWQINTHCGRWCMQWRTTRQSRDRGGFYTERITKRIGKTSEKSEGVKPLEEETKWTANALSRTWWGCCVFKEQEGGPRDLSEMNREGICEKWCQRAGMGDSVLQNSTHHVLTSFLP